MAVALNVVGAHSRRVVQQPHRLVVVALQLAVLALVDGQLHSHHLQLLPESRRLLRVYRTSRLDSA
jgi:hypothetical protein